MGEGLLKRAGEKYRERKAFEEGEMLATSTGSLSCGRYFEKDLRKSRGRYNDLVVAKARGVVNGQSLLLWEDDNRVTPETKYSMARNILSICGYLGECPLITRDALSRYSSKLKGKHPGLVPEKAAKLTSQIDGFLEKHPARRDLGRIVSGVIGTLGFLSAAAFTSMTVTGNVVNSNAQFSGMIGAVLFLIGIFGIYFAVRK
jgi:hypothetical protein